MVSFFPSNRANLLLLIVTWKIQFSQIFLFIESCRPIVGTVGCNVGWVGVSIGYRHTIVSYIGVLNPRVGFKGAL